MADVDRSPEEMRRAASRLDEAADQLAAGLDEHGVAILPAPPGLDPVSTRNNHRLNASGIGFFNTATDAIRKARAGAHAVRAAAAYTEGQDETNAEVLAFRASSSAPVSVSEQLANYSITIPVSDLEESPPPRDAEHLAQLVHSATSASQYETATKWGVFADQLDHTGAMFDSAHSMLAGAWRDRAGQRPRELVKNYAQWFGDAANSSRGLANSYSVFADHHARVVQGGVPRPEEIQQAREDALRYAHTDQADVYRARYQQLLAQIARGYATYAAAPITVDDPLTPAPSIAADNPDDPLREEKNSASDTQDGEDGVEENEEDAQEVSEASEENAGLAALTQAAAASSGVSSQFANMLLGLLSATTSAAGAVPQQVAQLATSAGGNARIASPAGLETGVSGEDEDYADDSDDDPFFGSDDYGVTTPMGSTLTGDGAGAPPSVLSPKYGVADPGGFTITHNTGTPAKAVIPPLPGVIPPMMAPPGMNAPAEKARERNKAWIPENSKYAGGMNFEEAIPAATDAVIKKNPKETKPDPLPTITKNG